MFAPPLEKFHDRKLLLGLHTPGMNAVVSSGRFHDRKRLVGGAHARHELIKSFPRGKFHGRKRLWGCARQ